MQECTDAICVTVDATRVDVYMGDRFWSAYAHMSAVAQGPGKYFCTVSTSVLKIVSWTEMARVPGDAVDRSFDACCPWHIQSYKARRTNEQRGKF